jgi:hypothetical protein
MKQHVYEEMEGQDVDIGPKAKGGAFLSRIYDCMPKDCIKLSRYRSLAIKIQLHRCIPYKIQKLRLIDSQKRHLMLGIYNFVKNRLSNIFFVKDAAFNPKSTADKTALLEHLALSSIKR